MINVQGLAGESNTYLKESYLKESYGDLSEFFKLGDGRKTYLKETYYNPLSTFCKRAAGHCSGLTYFKFFL